jgi:protein-S-isoprenylcysteine O-methyltransferase Ste14
MKIVAQVVGVVGVLVALLAVYGRFHHQPTLTLQGHTFAAGSVLLLANTLLLVAAILLLLEQTRAKPQA